MRFGSARTGARRLGVGVLAGALAVAAVGIPQTANAEPTTANADPTTGPTATEPTSFVAMRVMPLGDSITLGTGTPARDGYRKGLAHRLLLGGMQINFVGSQSNGSGSDPQHEGHGGYNIDELAAEADDWLAQARPDVVLLHAGTNSIKEGVGARATAAKLSALIDQVRAARPEAYIFVAQITASRVSKERADGRAYNELIPGLVAKKNDPKITVVDQSSVGGIDLHDLRHPNAFGYSKMAYNWYASMAKVFQLAGGGGRNPYKAKSSYRCLAVETVVHGDKRHATECRTWKLRTVTTKVGGVRRQVRAWQTLRTVKQSYRVEVGGRTQTRTRLVKKWTGPRNLLKG
ncbi:SGNH/GDSL hydrolase family protein [Amorphoplanes digitatis]|uniref:Lysophospholipase L1-like esterase n=1 Tax=Actinoplanes digitatis TaxID=1868 RepID=A0A7W7HU56_9ACTN|nr:SGNH/GDSL hydrolase family protein [Actinoplanes digitatis]MBB4760827.1 lysophospholipase L1-like esterase [Actinoplanes digitatis]